MEKDNQAIETRLDKLEDRGEQDNQNKNKNK